MTNTNIFPIKLWRLVNDSKIDAIVWNQKGNGIIVNNKLIEEEFLSSNGFKATSFLSFVRRLNFYGFKKSQGSNRDNAHHYFHPNFQRNQPKLLPLLRKCNQRSGLRVEDQLKTDLYDRGDATLHHGEFLSVNFKTKVHHSHHHLQLTPQESWIVLISFFVCVWE